MIILNPGVAHSHVNHLALIRGVLSGTRPIGGAPTTSQELTYCALVHVQEAYLASGRAGKISDTPNYFLGLLEVHLRFPKTNSETYRKLQVSSRLCARNEIGALVWRQQSKTSRR